VEFAVLGPLAAWRDGEPVGLGTPKGRVVLALLLSSPGRSITVDALADALWGEAQPKSAAKNLQTYVHRLRQAFGDPARIVRDGHGYLLRAGRDEVDATRFEDLTASARSAVRDGDAERARELYDQALALWRGPAYAGIGDVPALTAEIARLEELRLRVVEERIDADLRLDRHGELVGELTALTAQHPLRERLWAQLMLALHRCGRRADALGAYLRARDVLAEETGLDPGPQLRDLHRAILDEDEAPAPAPDARSALPRMLPPALGDFTGQQAGLAEIDAVLGGARDEGEPPAIVTISGQGGIGKTALAVQAAHRLAPGYPDGQLFATLAGTRAQPVDPALVLGRFLRALGVPATAVPDDPEERAGLYRSLLAGRRVLVVLDDALDESQVAPLLPASGACGVLITGRVRLAGLGGARRVRLGEMSEDDGLALLHRTTAGRLAAAPRRDLVALVRSCARLPLALRIAGSLLESRPHWGLRDLVSRLADEQHRLDALRYRDLEVRASFGLSYEGLSAPERRLFRLLGLVEAPDFPLWTAAAVLDTDPHRAQELLDRLVDVHLIDVTGTPHGQARYAFHDLVRTYARERAETEESTADRAAAITRALGALLALTDIADRDHMGQNMFQQDARRWRPDLVEATLPAGATPMAVLESERLALVAGVRQAADTDRDELCAELAVGAQTLFETLRFFDDWQDCHRTALAVTRAKGNLRGQARLLISMAGLLYTRRRYGPAEEANTEAMRLFERIGDRRGYLETLSNAPFFLVPNGRLTEAIEAGTEAYRRLTENGQTAAALHAYSQVGLAHLQAGRPRAAAASLAEVIAGARDHGIRTLIARDTYWLGQAELALGHFADADKAFTELSTHAGDIGPSGDFYVTHAWGCLHLARGEHTEARRTLREAVHIARSLNDPMFETRVLVDLLETELRDQVDVPAAIGVGEHAAGVARGINYPYLLTGVLERLAALHAAAGDEGGAARVAAEAAAVRARIT